MISSGDRSQQAWPCPRRLRSSPRAVATAGRTPRPSGEDLVPRFGTLDNPVTLQTYEDNPPIDSNLEPEAGPARDLQLGAVHLEARCSRTSARSTASRSSTRPSTTWSRRSRSSRPARSTSTSSSRRSTTSPSSWRAKLIQPLNHDYIPNIKNLWPVMQDPYYDQGSQYTVPYTIYHTGIGLADRHRSDGGRGGPGDVQPLRDLLERRLRGQGRDLRRLPRGTLARDVPRPRGPDGPRTKRTRR